MISSTSQSLPAPRPEYLREPIRLSALWRRTLYVILTLLTGSGTLWLYLHHFCRHASEFGEQPHPLEPWMLRLHGAAAMATLIAQGALGYSHMRKSWHLRKNRRSGALLMVLMSSLVVTGYLLYYWGGEESRSLISITHWTLGLLLPLALPLHIWMGRIRKTARPSTSPPQKLLNRNVSVAPLVIDIAQTEETNS